MSTKEIDGKHNVTDSEIDTLCRYLLHKYPALRDEIELQRLQKKIADAVVSGQLPQTGDDFLKRKFPPKRPLIHGVLHKRDRIALVGRRRHGKTDFICNLGLLSDMTWQDGDGDDITLHGEYLGYGIPHPFVSLMFYLEDDPAELQDKIEKMSQGKQLQFFHLYTKDDFRRWKIEIGSTQFWKKIEELCAKVLPDVVCFDNLGKLIGADYNNAPKIEAMTRALEQIEGKYDAAWLVAAHPRKKNKLDDGMTLRSDPEQFFEECMGASHFINSCGTLWGIERNLNTNETGLHLGAQRISSDYGNLTLCEHDSHKWFKRIDDYSIRFDAVVNTEQRRAAWDALPDQIGSFTDAWNVVSAPGKKIIGSRETFTKFWGELKRSGVIREFAPKKFEKAKP